MVAIEHALQRFNRKERFIVAEWLLAPAPFSLGQTARSKLASALGDRGVSEVPKNAFVAIDYHLDWVYAALCIHKGDWTVDGGSPYPRPDGSELTANQEDIDAIVAWTAPKGTAHIVLIEAKAYTGWTNKQLQSKADRLSAIFGETGDNWGNAVDPHFILAGPKPATGIDDSSWPKWMRSPATIDLPAPVGPRSAVTRCDDHGRPSAKGQHVQVTAARWPGTTDSYGPATQP